ncbi:multidrug resistance efflux pump [Mesorhizobium soli]|uniref:HlyD family secretion protein n=1 Tax=Pseudaminobacter soli (ex Li et al. 2025) TaxID=1295366 RepID=UPI00247480F8|nr:HlyD family secretion protein [Mesorhizobium soli]MDH6234732.1 multidrug resistance efflux pump [Mesorhizobium soli]
MLEFMICSMLTIFPDYLFRRYVQGKRIGQEINLYTMWFELRWGITACVILTLSLITAIFYFHPSTSNVTAIFRTVTILPETNGRVKEVYVNTNDKVEAGAPLFRLDDAKQKAAIETASRRVEEIDAETTVTETELAEADGVITQAEGALQQAVDEYETQVELNKRNPNVVARREIEKLQVATETKKGGLAAAVANKTTLETKISSLLPAQRASAEAELAQAKVEFEKTVVRAGTAGTVQQFSLRPGDIVNPLIRSAGILIPEDRRVALVAGFGQIESQVLRPGMIAEVTCIGKPFTIIPMVVTEVQEAIAAGQMRPTDQLIDVQQIARPGTLTTYLEPLYEGQLEGIPPGSSCIANAYTSNHDELEHGNLSTGRWFVLHAIDAVGLVHAMILRLQAIMLPVQTLVLTGH